jgi:oligopeptide transport system ATP-binding protein
MIELRELRKHFRVGGGAWWRASTQLVRAVDGVCLVVNAGDSVGIVGESGSGKSTLGQMVLGLTAPTSGQILLDGRPLPAGARAVAALKGQAQVVFQDPYDALNPRQRVREIVTEPLRNLGTHSRAALEDAAVQALQRVGLHARDLDKFPHQFSGGQRQRIGIARALAVNPKLIVCDEAVSALDVSIQAQVINLLEDLQAQFGLTYIFIAHDLSVVEHISDRVAVMYLGRIVEIASAKDLYTAPRHPYTEALLSAVPIPDPQIKRKRIMLQGDVPSPLNPPSGCHFHTRCSIAQKGLCDVQRPELKAVAGSGDGHQVACHLRS